MIQQEPAAVVSAKHHQSMLTHTEHKREGAYAA